MADELIDIVDENDVLTGIQKMKSEAHTDGSWHRCAHIWIYNSKKEVLLQYRAKDKFLYPDAWDTSAAGHIGAGEDILDGAVRETKEEIGLDIDKDKLQLHKIEAVGFNYKGSIINEIYYIYYYKLDKDFDKNNLQFEEVTEIKFFNSENLKSEIGKNPDSFTPNMKYWFEILEKIN